jgi:hypothetical protein
MPHCVRSRKRLAVSAEPHADCCIQCKTGLAHEDARLLYFHAMAQTGTWQTSSTRAELLEDKLANAKVQRALAKAHGDTVSTGQKCQTARIVRQPAKQGRTSSGTCR